MADQSTADSDWRDTDLPLRQRTLRNTIAWSYNFLADGEKRLLSRLAVFCGGCSLDAAETVCGSEAPGAVFDELASLVDKSLVQRIEPPDGTARFILLAVIHEYAREQLEAGGDLDALSRRHALYFAEWLSVRKWKCAEHSKKSGSTCSNGDRQPAGSPGVVGGPRYCLGHPNYQRHPSRLAYLWASRRRHPLGAAAARQNR